MGKNLHLGVCKCKCEKQYICALHLFLLVDRSLTGKYYFSRIQPEARDRSKGTSMETNIEPPPTLLLADDNPELLATLVEMLQTKYKIAAALPNGRSVLDQIGALAPDLVILDVSLGDLTGFEVARRLKEIGLKVKIIFLTVHEDIDFVSAAFDVGVSGYVFKSRVSQDLTRAIDIVLNGGRFSFVYPQEASRASH